MEFADGDYGFPSLAGVALLVVVFIIGMVIKVCREHVGKKEKERRKENRERIERLLDEVVKKREEEE